MGVGRTPEARLLVIEGVATDPERAWARADAATRARARRTVERLRRLEARIVLAADDEYPAGLRELSDPPAGLCVRGRLPEPARAVAIVGSRAATPYGIARARALGADLARLGLTVVSGLARGIDAAAHRGALDAGGASVAIVPGGLDPVHPVHHRDLADALCERGGVVTEHPTRASLWPGEFVRRNRLIAALAAATVVVEAAERSGALSTAAVARRLGRPVLAVPGDVERPTARGVHALLRGGARLCEHAGDVMAALPRGGPANPGTRVSAALARTPRTADDLAERAGLTLEETLACLLELEWSGVARRMPGPRWRTSR
jgi:DNA processing protein